MGVTIPLLLIAAAWAGLVLGVDPVPTWFYVFAWYPTLVLLDQLAARIGNQSPLLRGWKLLVSLFGWSAVIWLVFEAANFRLANWYYVFLPRHPVERWSGILLSFATVVPAIVLMTRLLAVLGRGMKVRSAALPFPPHHHWVPVALGLVTGGLTLGMPDFFFPLIWGCVWLLLEPLVYRRRPEHSLFADLARGDWTRTVRLLGAGLLVGGLWELYNFWARGKWIYTVPWLEDFKLFEMPPVGFLGFPFFALEAWAMYSALVVLGGAVPVEVGATEGEERRQEGDGGRWRAMEGDDRGMGTRSPSPHIAFHRLSSPFLRLLTPSVALVFATAVLFGMEHWTISSVVPRLSDIPGMQPGHVERLAAAGIDTPFELARFDVPQLVRRSGIPPGEARRLTETARLVVLRGLGVPHARRLHELGIDTRCTLARQDPTTLWSRYHDRPVTFDPPTVTPPTRPTPAEVRVWVTSARRACVNAQSSPLRGRRKSSWFFRASGAAHSFARAASAPINPPISLGGSRPELTRTTPQ